MNNLNVYVLYIDVWRGRKAETLYNSVRCSQPQQQEKKELSLLAFMCFALMIFLWNGFGIFDDTIFDGVLFNFFSVLPDLVSFQMKFRKSND